MTPSMISVYVLFACFLVAGCDTKAQKQQAVDNAAAAELAEFGDQNKKRIVKQLESEGVYFPESTDSLDQFTEMMEEKSAEASPELATQLRSQAAILKEFKGLVTPYLNAGNKFYERGGIDAVTLASIEDIDARLAMIEELIELNETIDRRFPELFMQIAGSGSPEGRRQLAMAKEIRQAEREAYPHMIQSLQIVRKYWATSGNADDGQFYFGNDVPDEEVLRYNEHLQAIDAIGERQLKIQRSFYTDP